MFSLAFFYLYSIFLFCLFSALSSFPASEKPSKTNAEHLPSLRWARLLPQDISKQYEQIYEMAQTVLAVSVNVIESSGCAV